MDKEGQDWLDRLSPEQKTALDELLAIGFKELDDGLGIEFDVKKFIADGHARRAARIGAAAE